MIFLSSPIWLLFLTIALFCLGMLLTSKRKWIVFNPIIFSVLVLVGYLLVFNIPYEAYAKSSQVIDFFLKPSIVALAIPLYTQWHLIKKQIWPILASQFAGCVVGVVSVVLLAKALGAQRDIIVSLAPKSVSTPIALEVSESLGGMPSITAAAVMLTGIFGSMIGFKFLNLSRISNPISQGIAMGTSSHALGTLKAMEISGKYGAFATVGMIVNGVLTAVFAPLILGWLAVYL